MSLATVNFTNVTTLTVSLRALRILPINSMRSTLPTSKNEIVLIALNRIRAPLYGLSELFIICSAKSRRPVNVRRHVRHALLPDRCQELSRYDVGTFVFSELKPPGMARWPTALALKIALSSRAYGASPCA